MRSTKVYGQYCPVAKSLDIVGDRWTLLIVRDLLRGKQRFKELQGSLRGIAPNLLSDRLKRLEESGLVVRTIFKQIPPKVEYTLTDTGRALESVLGSLARFGMANLMEDPSNDEVIDPGFIFQAMPSLFVTARAKGIDAIVRFDISGDGGGTWFVKVSSRGCRVTSRSATDPTVTIATDAHTFGAMAVGSLDPKKAGSKGKLKISGDKALAERFPHLFVNRDDAIGASPKVARGRTSAS
ncbi:MAG: winged helix-turn-helix transcriptional regulator [Actinomycetota bacterium]|nr:winged helix-turn-helix transcriptional regulator [Actinomycetota bacterium]